jgi:arsenate reductase (glutaredoxin)
MTVTLYGISNCDTVRKARAWLDAKGIRHTFHDYKKLGADPARLSEWCVRAGWEKVLNRAGTTFRKLPEADKQDLDQTNAIRLMIEQPSMIRRPIVEHPDGLLIGFDPKEWERAIAA